MSNLRPPPQVVPTDTLQQYAKVVSDSNDVRLQNRPMQLIGQFEEVARKTEGEQIARCWELLGFLIGEKSSVRKDQMSSSIKAVPSTPIASNRLYPSLGGGNNTAISGTYREREFAIAYLGSSAQDKSAVELRQHFISGGRRWLEAL